MVLANLTDIVQSLEFLAKKSFKHVDNNHSKLSEGQMADLKEIQSNFSDLLRTIEKTFLMKEFGGLGNSIEQGGLLLDLIKSKIDSQIARTRKEAISPKNTALCFNLLLESKDLVKAVIKLVEEYYSSSSNS
jgi:hypothetical protein